MIQGIDFMYWFYKLPPLPKNQGEKKDLLLRNKIRHTADLIIIYPACLKVQRAENAKGNISLHICHHSNTLGLDILVAFKDS